MPVPLQVVQTIFLAPEQLTQVSCLVSPLPRVMLVVPVPTQKRHVISPVPSHGKQGWLLPRSSDASVDVL